MWKRFTSGMCSFACVVQCIIALPVSVTAVTIQDNSPSQATLKTAFNYNGHSYYTFSGKTSTWNESQQFCESLGGYLAVINDADENRFLYDMMKEQGYDSAYFGLTLHSLDEGVWYWEHDESSFENWDINEPSGGEPYGMFYSGSAPYKWNDGTFGIFEEGAAFICEWNYEDALLSQNDKNTVTIRVESKEASPNQTVECAVYLENSPGFTNYSVTLQYDDRLNISANGETSYSIDSYDLILGPSILYDTETYVDKDTSTITIQVDSHGNKVTGNLKIATLSCEVPVDARINTIYPIEIIDMGGEMILPDGLSSFPISTVDGAVTVKTESGNKFIYNGHSYAIFDNVVDTWDDAKEFCESLGGYLAVINNAEENQALFNLVRSIGYENVYFGYTDKESDGNWHWVENDTSSYENWGKQWDEPNGGEFEYYAMFYEDDPTGEWNDGDFGEEGFTVNSGNAFICEWNDYEYISSNEDGSFNLRYTGNDKKTNTVNFERSYSPDAAALYWNSNDYNPHLAYVLSILASSAYTPADIEYNLNALGFSDITMFNYYDNPVNPHYQPDSSAFSIAKKSLSNGDELIMIPIRGSYGALKFDDLTGKRPNSDWTSDLNIQDINDEIVHVGFTTAEQEIMDKLLCLLGEIPTTGVKFMITGHSRAAGVGNLLAKDLIDFGVPQENVFDYNFACPDVAKDRSSNWNPNGSYDSIFNIGVAGDPVTVIPGCLGNLIDEANPDMIHYKYGHWGKYGQSRWVCLDWKKAPLAQIDFNNHAHEFYVENMAANTYFMQMKTWKQMQKSEFISGLRASVSMNPVINLSSVSIHCPVSVELLNPDGNIIASISEQEVFIDENYNDGSVIAWAEDDEKFFILFNIAEYTINMTGTDSGSMDCGITSLVNGQYQTSSGAFYENIDLYEGKEMKIDINATSNYQGKELQVLADAELKETIKPDYFKAPSIYGDMNHDNQLLIADAVLLSRFTAEDTSLDLSNLDLDMADVNCDGLIDLLDIVDVLRILEVPAE